MHFNKLIENFEWKLLLIYTHKSRQ